jgi:hypothetical protein
MFLDLTVVWVESVIVVGSPSVIVTSWNKDLRHPILDPPNLTLGLAVIPIPTSRTRSPNHLPDLIDHLQRIDILPLIRHVIEP